ncbi:MAG: OmpA family protein, partial [Bacteroidota bacterium]
GKLLVLAVGIRLVDTGGAVPLRELEDKCCWDSLSQTTNANTRVPSTERRWSAKGNPNNTYPPARVEEQRPQYPPTEYRQPAPATYQTPVRNTTTRQPEPATYGYPATTRTTPAPNTGIPAGISFIPNTAYPDGAGYGGLDQLVRQIQSATSVVEIRVHTPAQLDRRAAQLLSEERAITIRDYLLEQGISAKHFRVLGYGNNLTGQGGERVEVLR